jgi:hypothetical protein
MNKIREINKINEEDNLHEKQKLLNIDFISLRPVNRIYKTSDTPKSTQETKCSFLLAYEY